MQYTEEQIARANQTDLVSFLNAQGEQLVKSGREYRWKKHDSVTVSGNRWYRHSQNKGGYPVDFVMEFYHVTFPEAVKMLIGEEGEGRQKSCLAPSPDFRLPEKSETNETVIKYLTEIRIKEIIKNNFGTPAPIPFQDWSHPIPNQMTGQMIPLRVEVKCFGKYTFKISNPAAFMNEIAGTANVYRKADLLEQMRAEVIASFQNVLNELGNSEHKVPVLELPSRTDEIKRTMDEKVFDEPLRRRGISIIGFAVESVTLDEDSEKKIDSYELSSNSYMQQGTLVGAYSNAVQDAAKNANGAANGFMGIGMMNMASGNVMTGAVTGPWQNAQNGNANNQTITKEQAVDKKDTWECPNCKKEVEGNFCSTCGTKKQTEKFCPNCGKKVSNDAKFCTECGTKL